MRVEKNAVIYVGENSQGREVTKAQGDVGNKKQAKSIFAGEFGFDSLQNRIAQKKEKAREKAMKVVKDAWAGDKVIDKDLQERKENIDALQQENKEINDTIKYIEGEKKRLSGIAETDDSVAEHQAALDEELEYYQDVLKENTEEIFMENAVISGTKIERLKYAPMVKAQKQAEEIMDSASKDIVGMVVEDAKNHIDEEQEKREEQAEEIKEEREAKEELLDKRAEEKKEREEFYDEMPIEEMIALSRDKVDVQKEVKEILDEMKLIAEDIKGAVLDKEV